MSFTELCHYVKLKKEKKGYISESRKQPKKCTKEVIEFMIENYKGNDNIY